MLHAIFALGVSPLTRLVVGLQTATGGSAKRFTPGYSNFAADAAAVPKLRAAAFIRGGVARSTWKQHIQGNYIARPMRRYQPR